MPIIRAENAPLFNIPGLAVVGLAAPSRGSRETSVWRLSLPPGTPGVAHSVDREEIFVALAGSAVASLQDEHIEIHAGDTLIVPAGEVFSLGNSSSETFDAIAVAPVGVRAQMPTGESLVPPWTE
jgi:quercetin dioxygenase-like cupin family protein